MFLRSARGDTPVELSAGNAHYRVIKRPKCPLPVNHLRGIYQLTKKVGWKWYYSTGLSLWAIHTILPQCKLSATTFKRYNVWISSLFGCLPVHTSYEFLKTTSQFLLRLLMLIRWPAFLHGFIKGQYNLFFLTFTPLILKRKCNDIFIYPV